MSLHPIVFLTPSLAAALELPRRLASSGRALAGIYPFKVLDLARALAEPVLLGRGLRAWDSGHDALLAARLLGGAGSEGAGFGLSADLPRGPVAATLARTLQALRRARVPPGALEELARESTHTPADAERRRTLARVYQAFHESSRSAPPTPPPSWPPRPRAWSGPPGWRRPRCWWSTTSSSIRSSATSSPPSPASVRCEILQRELPPGLRPSSFRAWAEEHGIPEAEPAQTPLGPLAPPPAPEGLARLRRGLFEPPAGSPVDDGSVALVSAPGEAAEVRAIVRRLLDEAARGVPFEEMGVVLPRPEAYAPLFTDLLDRLGVPHRLHPSLPLRFGRSARSLLLLLRCRGLGRSAVMEFLTFAPVPLRRAARGGRRRAAPAVGRDQPRRRVVSGLDRWMIGLRAYAEAEREAGAEGRARSGGRGACGTSATRRRSCSVVEALSATLDTLSGSEPWSVWSERLRVGVRAVDRSRGATPRGCWR